MGLREDLYRDRAEYADIESDCADAKKYTRVGGIFWRLFSWIERRAREERQMVQREIDELSPTPTGGTNEKP